MELREQTYILAIARHGGIKRAAEELHITPPTLSIFLSNMEQALGAPLFDRLGRRFIPTEVGELYISIAQKMLDLQYQYQEQMKALKNEKYGVIQFGIHPRRTLYLLAEVLAEFTPTHPNIQIATYERTSDEMFSLLLEGKLDFIINNRTHPDPSLVFLPLYQDRLVMVTAADHPLAEAGVRYPGEAVPWMDLALFQEETFILASPPQSARIYTDLALAYAGVQPKRVYQLENLEASAQLAAEGLGITFNLESYIRRFQYKKPVRYFYVGDPELRVDYSVAYRRDKYMPAYTQEFIAILKQTCSQEGRGNIEAPRK